MLLQEQEHQVFHTAVTDLSMTWQQYV